MPARGEPVIECHGVAKRFYVYEHRTTTLQELFQRFILRKPIHVRSPLFRLEPFDLLVCKGEGVALIGGNGSGKSTALRLLAGVYTPSEGTVRTVGRTVAIIELGATFQPELTGEENLFLYAIALGLTPRQVRERRASMFAFAGIGDFAGVPLKYYSSGMRVRLAAAIALHADPDILLLDEVLAVGDAEFTRQCQDRLEAFQQAGGTLVVVAHDMSLVRRFCQRAIWLDHGKVRLEGSAYHVTHEYLVANGAPDPDDE